MTERRIMISSFFLWVSGFIVLAPSLQAGGDDSVSGIALSQRRYFQEVRGERFSQIGEGMTETEVRTLLGGIEYPAFETRHGGFAFALDEERSGFLSFPDWTPPENRHVDFFVAEEALLVVYYDKDYKVTSATKHSREAEKFEWISPTAKLYEK